MPVMMTMHTTDINIFARLSEAGSVRDTQKQPDH
jgi:hypothetical protein